MLFALRERDAQIGADNCEGSPPASSVDLHESEAVQDEIRGEECGSDVTAEPASR